MITPGELDDLRRTVEESFPHTYTRTPRNTTSDNPATPATNEGEDAWGEQVVTHGTPQAGRPCKYKEQSTPVITANGLENLNVPTLWVPSSDALSLGDLVSQVIDAYGSVLVGGPVEVEDVSAVALIAGAALHLQVRLRQVQNI